MNKKRLEQILKTEWDWLYELRWLMNWLFWKQLTEEEEYLIFVERLLRYKDKLKHLSTLKEDKDNVGEIKY